MNLVSDLMTKNVSFVYQDTSVIEAAQIMFTNGFEGLPVITKDNKVVGIVTEYELITKGNQMHLPTLVKLMKEFSLYRQDKSLIRDDLKKLVALKVGDVMNKDPLVLAPAATIEDAAKVFAEHHRVNPIPVVDQNNRLMGILSRYDIIKLYAGGEITNMHHPKTSERNLDARVDQFIDSFEKEFIMVSKFRTKFWFIISLLFLIVGFILAFSLILRIGF